MAADEVASTARVAQVRATGRVAGSKREFIWVERSRSARWQNFRHRKRVP